MEQKSLGFIGAGRVTRIFLQALKNRKVSFRSISLMDTNNDVLNRIKKDFPEVNITYDDMQQIMNSDVVFIALHPPVIIEMLEKIKPLLNRETILVSLAPKFTIEKINLKLDGFQNIARLIPNAPSVINEGYNPVCFSAGMSLADRQFLTELFELLGKCIVVDEPKLEAYAIVTAMSPTYFWFQFHELSEIGKKIGLTEEECRKGISETVKASVNTLFSSGMPVNEVIDLIPVKPISEHESQIKEIYNSKLISLFEKIKPCC
jgi:pyrroline-5-carboxylate reductase